MAQVQRKNVADMRAAEAAAPEPEVSVVVPAYRAHATIERALASAQAQADVRIEIIVVVDGSPDTTAVVVAGMAAADPAIRLIELPSNRGVSHATNVGIRAARGAYIAFLDADDEWLPGKLAAQLAAFRAAPDAVMCATACEWRDADGQLVFIVPRPNDMDERAFYAAYYRESMVALPSVMVPRACFQTVGLFDEQLDAAQDQDMWLRLAFAGRVMFLDEVLTRIHMAPASLTRRLGARGYWLEKMIFDRYLPALVACVGKRRAQALYRQRLAVLGRDIAAAGQWWPGLKLAGSEIMRGRNLGRNLRCFIASLPGLARWLVWLKRRG